MPEIKSKRIAIYAIVAIVCLAVFATTFLYTISNEAINNDKVSPVLKEIKTSPNKSVTIDNNFDKKKQQSSLPKQSKFNTNWKPREYPPPSKEVLKAIMRNSYIKDDKVKNKATKKQQQVLLTAIVNSGMMDYTFNWIQSLKNTKQDDKFLVFAIDQGVVDEMTAKGYGDNVIMIPDDWYHVHLSSDFALWKSDDYRPITHAKSLIVERLLILDITVWFTDVDIVFLSPYILDTMLLQMAEKPNTHMIFSQEVDQLAINSGFYMMKPTLLTKQYMAKVIEWQDRPNNELTQQKIMNRALRSMFSREGDTSPFRLLDMLLFPNGYYYFRMGLPTKLGFDPLIVHANYLVGDNKKVTLLKAGLWFDKK